MPESDCKRRTLSLRGREPDCPVQHFHDPFHLQQAEACSCLLGITGIFRPVDICKYMFSTFLWNTYPVVTYVDCHPFPRNRHRHLHKASRPCIFTGVGHQIVEQLFKKMPVPRDTGRSIRKTQSQFYPFLCTDIQKAPDLVP